MPKRNLAWILVIMMIAGLMWQLPQTIARRDSVAQAFGPLVDARALIHKRFVRSVDDGELVSSTVEGGIDAMIKSLGDPYAPMIHCGRRISIKGRDRRVTSPPARGRGRKL